MLSTVKAGISGSRPCVTMVKDRPFHKMEATEESKGVINRRLNSRTRPAQEDCRPMAGLLLQVVRCHYRCPAKEKAVLGRISFKAAKTPACALLRTASVSVQVVAMSVRSKV